MLSVTLDFLNLNVLVILVFFVIVSSIVDNLHISIHKRSCKFRELNQYSVTMIHLMLNDLRRPASEILRARLQFQGLILHLDGLIALAFTWTSEK